MVKYLVYMTTFKCLVLTAKCILLASKSSKDLCSEPCALPALSPLYINLGDAHVATYAGTAYNTPN